MAEAQALAVAHEEARIEGLLQLLAVRSQDGRRGTREGRHEQEQLAGLLARASDPPLDELCERGGHAQGSPGFERPAGDDRAPELEREEGVPARALE